MRTIKLMAAAPALLCAALALSLGGASRADDAKGPGPAQAAAPATPATAAFEKIKKLSGDWAGSDGKLAVVRRVVSGGSTVMETLMPGSGHEMVTMYYMDGDDLVLVHYCALGNQPRMKFKAGSDPSRIDFEFAGGANVDAAKGMHMHDLSLFLTDDDHLKTEWTLFAAGAKKDVCTFEHTRVKK